MQIIKGISLINITAFNAFINPSVCFICAQNISHGWIVTKEDAAGCFVAVSQTDGPHGY